MLPPPLNLAAHEKLGFRLMSLAGKCIVLCLMENGHTQAGALGFGVRSRGARAGPGCVFVFLQTLYSHLISAVPVTIYPAV